MKEYDFKEKKLLDIFNYYNREYKPFLIEKDHRNHFHEDCFLKLKNKKIESLLQNKIFKIKKIYKNYVSTSTTYKRKINEVAFQFEKNKNLLAQSDYSLETSQKYLSSFVNTFNYEDSKKNVSLIFDNLNENFSFWKEISSQPIVEKILENEPQFESFSKLGFLKDWNLQKFKEFTNDKTGFYEAYNFNADPNDY